MHHYVMGLVTTFEGVLSDFVEEPSKFDAFIALVSNYMRLENFFSYLTVFE
jgi:hypothetical protein